MLVHALSLSYNSLVFTFFVDVAPVSGEAAGRFPRALLELIFEPGLKNRNENLKEIPGMRKKKEGRRKKVRGGRYLHPSSSLRVDNFDKKGRHDVTMGVPEWRHHY